ncbi:MAG: alanine/ornithine racemase family PLP-dependent enzyme [Defluviitaleaceae bacterium]|nr:alanine/ornithine racemase family PLP-dependent enzyme [Defluviitaleaceae bacterium]
MNPKLIIDLKKLKHNAAYLADLCHKNGITLMAVTKVFCADEEMVETLLKAGVDYLGDSRLENMCEYPAYTGNKKQFYLRLPSPQYARDVVVCCDVSLNSEMATLQALEIANEPEEVKHGILLMVDLGDLREGVYHTDVDKIYELCDFVLGSKYLRFEGIGTNLTCYGSVLPNATNMAKLAEIADNIYKRYGIDKMTVSGGNSSSLVMLAAGELPPQINNLRLGESIVCGFETAYGKPFAGLEQDVVTLQATIIEIAKKPSLPEGETNINAFGESVQYTDHGEHLRAILAVGRQDTDYEGLTPLDEGVVIIGASSDHLIVDVTNAADYAVGDVLNFSLSYGAVLAGFTSRYVDREYLG